METKLPAGVSVDSDVYYRKSLLFIVVWSSGSVARSSRSTYTDVYIIAAIAREILPITIITTIVITAVITIKPVQQFHFIPAHHAFYAYVSYCINIRIVYNESFFQLSDNLSALKTCVHWINERKNIVFDINIFKSYGEFIIDFLKNVCIYIYI